MSGDRSDGERARCARTAAILLGLAVAVGTAACERGPGLPPGELAEEILRARTEGLTFLQRDELAEAEARFTRLVELAPGEPAGHANLALVHLRRGELEAAEEAVGDALERAPDDPDLLLILARIREVGDEPERAREALLRSLEANPDHLRTLWALAELAGADQRPDEPTERLREAVRVAPGNPAARLALARAHLDAARPDSAAAHLEALRQRIPRVPEEAREALDAAVEALQLDRPDEAASPLRRFRELFEVTPAYQVALEDLRGPPGEMVGIPFPTFSHEFSIRIQEQGAVLAALRFRDATIQAGLSGGGSGPPTSPAAETTSAPGASAVAHGDFDGDGDEDLFLAGGEGGGRLLRDDLGRLTDVTEEAELTAGRGDAADAPTHAAFADYDNDGHLDLLVLRSGDATLYRSRGEGSFEDVTSAAGLGAAGGRAALFADLDHDGDLDLFVAGSGPDHFYRNDGDGSFSEGAAAAGLVGGGGDGRDAHMGDFDDDGDLDLLVVSRDAPPSLMDNLRGGRFADVASDRGLAGAPGGDAAAVGDFDNDGRLDLFLADARGGGSLWRNTSGGFEAAGAGVAAASADLRVTDATFLDFDNDGHVDLLLSGEPAAGDARPLRLLHNEGADGFRDMTDRLPAAGGADAASPASGGVSPTVAGIGVYDYNEDGDLDVVVAGEGGVRLLRNDGGNVNHWVTLRLRGLRTGSGKNNYFGIGSRVELRAGDLYQARVATGPRVHIGLGSHLKADVIRVEWTNGTPQTLYYPGTDRDLEEQALKGSCPFLYTWDGDGFTFVKDVMWRSALGMPVGIMGGAEGGGRRAYAPAEASREFLLVPGDVLVPRDGRWVLQITEELWEAVYVDEVRLVAVDHPDSVDLVVDEKFLPPGPARLRLHPVVERIRPRTATDGNGADLREALAGADDRYVDNLRPGRYQGVVEPHDLILDFGDLSALEHPILVLRGWVFPTDASINVAMAQSGERTTPPYLQVPDGEGRWRRVSDAGIPSGKDKTVVVDLDGLFLSDDHRLRIRTDMRIYWDEAYVASAAAVTEAGLERPGDAPGLRVTPLEPAAADLHYRGFSRLYRKGGRHGPHWFDYDDVSTEPAWRDLVGSYTRYGDVRPLLLEPDDMYVILNAGDEMTVEFDASSAPPLPDGWSRDFLLYTVGWIKDGDLNTATGGTVEPLPFHGMTRYPYGPDESYPDDAEHRSFREEYLTRTVP